jgi:ubiquinone/menaquinone biosynthesis C-methylase UbiE
LVGNAENPAIVSSSFDLVLVFAGLHHLSNMTKAIQNGYRVLRSGGRFVAFEPNASCWYRKPMLRLKSILGLYTEDEKFLYPQKVKDQMEAAGFVDIEIKYLTPEYNPAHLRTLLNRTLAYLMKLAVSIHDGPHWQSFFIILGSR